MKQDWIVCTMCSLVLASFGVGVGAAQAQETQPLAAVARYAPATSGSGAAYRKLRSQAAVGGSAIGGTTPFTGRFRIRSSIASRRPDYDGGVSNGPEYGGISSGAANVQVMRSGDDDNVVATYLPPTANGRGLDDSSSEEQIAAVAMRMPMEMVGPPGALPLLPSAQLSRSAFYGSRGLSSVGSAGGQVLCPGAISSLQCGN